MSVVTPDQEYIESCCPVKPRRAERPARSIEAHGAEAYDRLEAQP